jgi:type III secretion system FlhB-like substrate exporter
MGLILTKQEFSKKIDEMVVSLHITHMDAILEFAEKNDVDIEDIAKLVDRQLKMKIKENAIDLNFFPKKNKLPIVD